MAGGKDLSASKTFAQGNAAPIEFRTLSIHVTETNRSGNFGEGGIGSRKNKGKKRGDLSSESDFFATIDFHKLTPNEIDLCFNSNPTRGLDSNEARRRLQTNGPNTLKMRKPNYVKKILGYLFGGFCSILWVGVITFFICWQPPLSNPPNATNLVLAILIVSLLCVVATLTV